MFNKIRYAVQRARRGFSDHDAWDFFTWQAEVIVNLCDYYLKLQWSHPCGLKVPADGWRLIEKEGPKGKYLTCDCDCDAEWDRILTKIRDGFKLIAEGEDEEEDSLELKPEVKEAQELFHEHYRSLWL